MHGFINSPALSKLVALQMVDEQIQTNNPERPRKARTSLRTRLLSRRTAPRAASPAPGPRMSPTGQLVQEGR